MQDVKLTLLVVIALCLVALLVGAVIAGFLAYRKGVKAGIEQRKQQAEGTIGSAEKEAGRILEDAKRKFVGANPRILALALQNAFYRRRRHPALINQSIYRHALFPSELLDSQICRLTDPHAYTISFFRIVYANFHSE